jgi:hypothetical protein
MSRFYTSLGNVVASKTAGLTFTDFSSGSTLHVTGAAEVLFGDEAAALMQRTPVLLVLHIAAYQFAHNFHSYRSAPGSDALSPYDPIARPLVSEAGGNSSNLQTQQQQLTAVSHVKLSLDMSSFTFRTQQPVQYLPGQHAIIDLSEHKAVKYQHMCDANPQM